MKKLYTFRYVYLVSLVFWLFMAGWFFSIILKKDSRIGYKSQFSQTGERFLFQEKRFVISFQDQAFGVLKTFFSLSEKISFEMDMNVKYRFKGTESSQKIYGKITADRLRNIKDVLFIFKNREKDSEKLKLTSFRGKFNERCFDYEIIVKGGTSSRFEGSMDMKGNYWLINPVFPFGRNMKFLKQKEKYMAFYDPWSRKFERIEYTFTENRELINDHKAIEVRAKMHGMEYSLFLTSAGELLKVVIPPGLTIQQMPSDSKVELDKFIDVENVFRVFRRSMLQSSGS